MLWSDQQPVVDQETICSFYIGDGLSIEIEKVDIGFHLNPEYRYRLTVGSLFASSSALFPQSEEGMCNLLRTLQAIKNRDGKPVEPIGGVIEPRKHETEHDETH